MPIFYFSRKCSTIHDSVFGAVFPALYFRRKAANSVAHSFALWYDERTGLSLKVRYGGAQWVN